jgi:type II secretory pathway pseudopilin PulG
MAGTGQSNLQARSKAARTGQPTDSTGPRWAGELAGREEAAYRAAPVRGVLVEVAVQAVTAAIALAALVVSILVARRQTRIQEQQVAIQEQQARIQAQQTGIQERLAAVEEARRTDELAARERARVTADVWREGPDDRRRSLRLVLRNEGPAVARGVNVAVDDSPPAPGLIGLEVLPADLQPGQVMKFIITMGLGDRPTLQVMVRWTDAAGDHEAPYTLPLY